MYRFQRRQGKLVLVISKYYLIDLETLCPQKKENLGTKLLNRLETCDCNVLLSSWPGPNSNVWGWGWGWGCFPHNTKEFSDTSRVAKNLTQF